MCIVYVCVCAFACVYVYVYVCVFACACVCVSVCLSVDKYVQTHIICMQDVMLVFLALDQCMFTQHYCEPVVGSDREEGMVLLSSPHT